MVHKRWILNNIRTKTVIPMKFVEIYGRIAIQLLHYT